MVCRASECSGWSPWCYCRQAEPVGLPLLLLWCWLLRRVGRGVSIYRTNHRKYALPEYISHLFFHSINAPAQVALQQFRIGQSCWVESWHATTFARRRLSTAVTFPSRVQSDPQDNETMRTILALTSLLGFCASAVQATALTYRLEAHEKACFFANTEYKATKIAFYFAVRIFFFLLLFRQLQFDSHPRIPIL